MRLAEVFGPTYQGEGPSLGTRAVFVRLAGCNLDCAWCDTPYTWDWRGRNGIAYDPAVEVHKVEPEAIAADVTERLDGAPLVVITGGEPLAQGRSLRALVKALPRNVRVEIETNGTMLPPVRLAADVRVGFNVSPKLAHSGIEFPRRWIPDVIDYFATRRAEFKIVVQQPADVDELADLLTAHPLITGDRVWLMPEGRDGATLDDHLGAIADAGLAHGYNLTTRLHVHAWGDQRGR